MMQLAEFLNGDWRRKKGLEHYCYGACCSGIDESAAKLEKWLVGFLLQHKRDFSRNNWKSWHRGLAMFGLAGSLHNFLGTILVELLRCQAFPEHEALPALQEDNRDGAVGEEGEGEMQEGQNYVADELQMARQDKAKSMRIAQSFLSGPWFHDVWVLRATLDGEIRAMSRLLHSCSDVYDVQQQHLWANELRRSFRIVDLFKGHLTTPLMQASLSGFEDRSLWAHFAETQNQRSIIFRASFKPAALTWQLIEDRYTRFPWKVFALLDSKDITHCHLVACDTALHA